MCVRFTARYLYFTVLRDPIHRYISEWKHVQRGSTWQSAKLMCNGRQASLNEVPFCFQGRLFQFVKFASSDEFLGLSILFHINISYNAEWTTNVPSLADFFSNL